MNKKILTFLFCSVLAIGIGSAAIISHFGLFSTSLNIVQPITTEGNVEQSIECLSGEICPGTEITILNSAPFSVDVEITNNAEAGIETTYTSGLELTKKTVDFNAPVWAILENKVQVEYTLVGNEFTAEVTTGAIAGYELIYYKDNSDRFNNPATAIKVNDVEGNLPYAEDGNAEDNDYCTTGEYKTCSGAKIWYVPSDAVTDGVIDWARASEFYFESKLIQFNSGGHITIYDELSFTPSYGIDNSLETGEYTITTEVNP